MLNKQVYEILIGLLQTHPCYLINWIFGALRQEVDLFDDHPLAFFDEKYLEDNPRLRATLECQEEFMTESERNIMIDEVCYLVLVIFGGFKSIRNDRRSINNIMMIASKVFEKELEESMIKKPKTEVTFEDILYHHQECGFERLFRIIFISQFANTQFIDYLFVLIVKKLSKDHILYDDGVHKVKRTVVIDTMQEYQYTVYTVDNQTNEENAEMNLEEKSYLKHKALFDFEGIAMDQVP